MPVNLYYTQKVRGFQQGNVKYSKNRFFDGLCQNWAENRRKLKDEVEKDQHCTYRLISTKNNRRNTMSVNLYYTQRIHWFCHGFHAEVIKPFVVGKQSVFKFPQRIFSGNLSKEQSQKLFPGGEMLAIPVFAWLFYDFSKTISGNEVEKLRIYVIVIHRSGLSC